MKIPCPHCGERPESEFTYGGDATVSRPTDYSKEAKADWMNYVFYRDNPRGDHAEYWHHNVGCRAWIKVTRNTATHDISAVQSMGDQS